MSAPPEEARIEGTPVERARRNGTARPAGDRRWEPPLGRLPAAGFVVVAACLLAAVGWAAAWSVQSRQPLGVALALILLGVCVAMGYEAVAVWRYRTSSERDAGSMETISELVNRAYRDHKRTWVTVYLMVFLVVGLLSMHFTRSLTSQADWALLGTAVLVLVNGALIAYWLRWLP
jgi:hypothetical protein